MRKPNTPSMKPLHQFPPGFKFVPSEHELLYYLRCKVNGVRTAHEDKVPLKYVELYDIEDPGSLFEDTDEDVVYVFTKLRKVTQNGSRYERQISGTSCTWKGSDKGEGVEEAGICVGWVKNFSLERNQEKVGYNMKEFTLDRRFVNNAEFEDYAVCIIKRKSKKGRKSKKTDLEEGMDGPELRILNQYDSHDIVPSSAVSDNDFTNIASSSMSMPPPAQLTEYQEVYETDIPPVPLMMFSDQGHHQNPYQAKNELIADVHLADQIYGYQHQNNNELVSSIPSAPCSEEYNPYQQELWMNSAVDFTQHDQKSHQQDYNSYIADLEMIIELASAPADISCVQNDGMYSGSTSQSVDPTRNQFKTKNTAAIVQPRTEPEPEPEPGWTAEGPELLDSGQKVEKSTAITVPSMTIPLSIHSEGAHDSLLPTTIQLEHAYRQHDMNVGGGECSTEFGQSLTALLTGLEGNALELRVEDPVIDNAWESRGCSSGYEVQMIDNQSGIENLREFMRTKL